jgi:hypothetical protein
MEITTREMAKRSGLVKYFTGRPCKNGHLRERYVVDGKCLACKEQAEQRAEYKEKRNTKAVLKYRSDPEPAKQRAREYKKNNAERERNRRRSYYKTHREFVIEKAKAYQKRKYLERQIQQATPSWADQDAIRSVYEKCDELNRTVGRGRLRVIHVVPLAGRTVCGLHIAENLRIVSESFERASSVRFTYADQDIESERYLKWLEERFGDGS